MRISAKWIKASGDVINISPKNGRDFELEELKEFIGGGYIETVPVRGKMLMIVDEDGRRKELPINHLATMMHPIDYIVGDVALIHRDQIV